MGGCARGIVLGEGREIGFVAIFNKDACWGARRLVFDSTGGVGFCARVRVVLVGDERFASAAGGICEGG